MDSETNIKKKRGPDGATKKSGYVNVDKTLVIVLKTSTTIRTHTMSRLKGYY
jgi:hypothetical protein